MKEYSLQSLKNDTESVLDQLKQVLGDSDASDSEQASAENATPESTTDTPTVTQKSTRTPTPTTETPVVTTKTPKATTKTPTTEDSSSGSETEYVDSGSESSDLSASGDDSDRSDDAEQQVDDSDSWYRSASSDDSYSSGVQQTTTAPSVTTSAPSLSDASRTGASAYDSSTQGITTSSATNSMPGGAIAGIVVGAACVMFMLAAFVTMRKRALNKQNAKGKDSLGSSRAMPLNSAGLFGRLNKRDSEMDEIFTIDNTDPFATKNLNAKKPQPTGIWDDPVLVAARIPLRDVHMKELISRGGFGEVYMGTYNGETVAVKTLLPETRKDMNEIVALFSEIKVMAKLEHPCIVRFVGIAWDSLSSVRCVTEYLVGGDLRAMLNHFQREGQRPQGFDHDKVKIALDVANGLTYLHSLEPAILHRDLKSRNVLLTSQLDAKLTDFGVSRERTDELMTIAVGTSLWMAPEVMMGGHYDGKADVFSFGVLLSEIDTHRMPYDNVKNPSGRKPTEAAILQMVAIGTLQVEFSDHCPSDIRKLAQSCLSLDPQDRPTAAEALYKLQRTLKSFEVEEVTL